MHARAVVNPNVVRLVHASDEKIDVCVRMYERHVLWTFAHGDYLKSENIEENIPDAGQPKRELEFLFSTLKKKGRAGD